MARIPSSAWLLALAAAGCGGAVDEPQEPGDPSKPAVTEPGPVNSAAPYTYKPSYSGYSSAATYRPYNSSR